MLLWWMMFNGAGGLKNVLVLAMLVGQMSMLLWSDLPTGWMMSSLVCSANLSWLYLCWVSSLMMLRLVGLLLATCWCLFVARACNDPTGTFLVRLGLDGWWLRSCTWGPGG